VAEAVSGAEEPGVIVFILPGLKRETWPTRSFSSASRWLSKIREDESVPLYDFPCLKF